MPNALRVAAGRGVRRRYDFLLSRIEPNETEKRNINKSIYTVVIGIFRIHTRTESRIYWFMRTASHEK